MWLISLLSAASEHLTSTGSCLVACLALVLATYVIRHLIDAADYVKIKSNNFEGEYRPRHRVRHKRPTVKS